MGQGPGRVRALPLRLRQRTRGGLLPRGVRAAKGDLSIYITSGIAYHTALLAKLGRHKAGKGCLYVRRLEDVDLDVLKQLITESVARVKKTYPGDGR